MCSLQNLRAAQAMVQAYAKTERETLAFTNTPYKFVL
jgi:hypothetical protein